MTRNVLIFWLIFILLKARLIKLLSRLNTSFKIFFTDEIFVLLFELLTKAFRAPRFHKRFIFSVKICGPLSALYSYALTAVGNFSYCFSLLS